MRETSLTEQQRNNMSRVVAMHSNLGDHANEVGGQAPSLTPALLYNISSIASSIFVSNAK